MLPFENPSRVFKKARIKLENLLLAPTIKKARFQGESLEYYVVDRNGYWTYIPPQYVNKHGKFQRWKFIYPWVLCALFLVGIVLILKVVCL